MQDDRTGVSTPMAALWFGISVVVALVNFSASLRPGGIRWLAIGLGVLAAVFAVRWGRILLVRYREREARRR